MLRIAGGENEQKLKNRVAQGKKNPRIARLYARTYLTNKNKTCKHTNLKRIQCQTFHAHALTCTPTTTFHQINEILCSVRVHLENFPGRFRKEKTLHLHFETLSGEMLWRFKTTPLV